MSITTQTLRKDYTANGINTIFAVDFPIFYESNATPKFSIEVITTDTSGIETIKIETIDYTITYTSIENGVIQTSNVVFNVAPINQHKVSILRKVNLTQNAEFTTTGTEKYSGKAVESALDKLTLQNLQIQESLNRVVRLPKSSSLINIEFPIDLNRADQAVVVNTTGDNLTTKNLADINLATLTNFAKTLMDDNNASEARTTLNAQQLNANLTALAGLTGASNKLPYFTGVGTMAVQDLIATATNRGISYINNPVTLVNEGTSITDTIGFNAGTFITSSGLQIYLPLIRKKIQSTGSWTAGDTNNGLDTGSRTASTFYRTFVIQNNSTGAYDILFSVSATSPTVPSGYTNLGIMDYAIIRVNASNNIAISKWHSNDKRLVLGGTERITFVNSTAGSGNVTILNTTEPLELVVRLYLSLTTTGASDFSVYGNEHTPADIHDTVFVATNNGFQVAGGGNVYTSDGKIYWKNFSTTGGVASQIGVIKSIKIRS